MNEYACIALEGVHW